MPEGSGNPPSGGSLVHWMLVDWKTGDADMWISGWAIKRSRHPCRTSACDCARAGMRNEPAAKDVSAHLSVHLSQHREING